MRPLASWRKRSASGRAKHWPTIDAAFFGQSLIPSSEWEAVANALSGGSKTDKDQGGRFRSLAKLSDAERLDTYLDIFCTGARDKVRERIVDQGHTGRIPGSLPAPE